MKGRKPRPINPADYVLALMAYKEQQERMRGVLSRMNRGRNKPKMSLEELRDTLSAELGDRSLSGELIKMRRAGY